MSTMSQDVTRRSSGETTMLTTHGTQHYFSAQLFD
jgi:hypothetical protein